MSAPVDEQLQHARERLAALDRERAETRMTIRELERLMGGPRMATAAGRVVVRQPVPRASGRLRHALGEPYRNGPHRDRRLIKAERRLLIAA